MTPTIDELAASKYLSLTTFKKDGTAVATPVWLVRDGEVLRVITGAESGKAKRLANNPSVLVAVCDSRGKLQGPQGQATAVLQDSVETAQTAAAIKARYGFLGRVLSWRAERAEKKAGKSGQVGITITM